MQNNREQIEDIKSQIYIAKLHIESKKRAIREVELSSDPLVFITKRTQRYINSLKQKIQESKQKIKKLEQELERLIVGSNSNWKVNLTKLSEYIGANDMGLDRTPIPKVNTAKDSGNVNPQNLAEEPNANLQMGLQNPDGNLTSGLPGSTTGIGGRPSSISGQPGNLLGENIVDVSGQQTDSSTNPLINSTALLEASGGVSSVTTTGAPMGTETRTIYTGATKKQYIDKIVEEDESETDEDDFIKKLSKEQDMGYKSLFKDGQKVQVNLLQNLLEPFGQVR